ncbi:MAG TPA: ADP-ribosylglycohydrolase family protein [Thermomicrobiales bacterium]|nr:ADP-ribosylglycohydrolase family protein [Thermomicrobiales bacterium]
MRGEFDLYDRVLGSLTWACIGDALGAPTEQRSIAEIRAKWGGRVERFEAPPADSPFAHGRRPGQITDDASQMLSLVDAYSEHGPDLTPRDVADALLRWAANDEYFPRFAGPSTRAGVARLRAGELPEEAGRIGRLTSEGTSNGAAMRVAPAGLAHPGDPVGAARAALVTCLPSHATNLAVAGAACVAAAVAAALAPGAGVIDVIRAARWGAAEGERLGRAHGREVAGPSVAKRLDLALELAATAASLDDAVAAIAGTVGTGLHISEAVPAALGIVLAAGGDPWLAVVGGANAGDDTDTIACIAGGVAGALAGFGSVPADLYRRVTDANDLDLERRAAAFVDAVATGGGR